VVGRRKKKKEEEKEEEEEGEEEGDSLTVMGIMTRWPSKLEAKIKTIGKKKFIYVLTI
jgi:hypothetical protein